jgi:hypothetical protein
LDEKAGLSHFIEIPGYFCEAGEANSKKLP